MSRQVNLATPGHVFHDVGNAGNRTYGIRFVALLLLVFTFAGSACARNMPVRRVPLNDEISLLDAQTAKEVKRFSQLLYRDHKSELAVLIIRSTEGKNAGAYAESVFNHWGLGQKGTNNGMLIMFAIDDRRVEIKPGIRYRDRFTESFCTSLLTRYVVPEMRAGRPGNGVVAATREVAAEIRSFEEAATGVRPANNLGKTPDKNLQTGEQNVQIASSSSSPGQKAPKVVTRPVRKSSGLPPVKSDTVRLIIFFIIILATAAGVYYFYQAYWLGRLLMPVWLFMLVMIAAGMASAGLASTLSDFFTGSLDAPVSGSGGMALLIFFFCATHICPRCNKYMSVSTRTLRHATYYSTGLGEKTVDCDNCGYHNVSTYTISRKTRSKSSSGSSGGGRSSGGGGGASW